MIEPTYAVEYDPYLTQTEAPRPDIQAEQTLLGALILQPTLIAGVQEQLEPSYFSDPRHETIYNALTAMTEAGTPIDTLTVRQHLAAEPRQRELALYLHDLTAKVANPTTAPYYATLIRDQARRRGLDHLGTRLRQLAREATPETLDQALDQAYTELDQAANQFGPGPTHHTAHTWAPVDLTGVLNGDFLDPPPTILARADGISLLYDGAVHTISGESESGKTWLALHATTQLLADKQKVLFLDFEDRADRVVARLLSLGAHPTNIRDHFTYVRPDRPLDDGGQAQLAPHLAGVRLVILDGVTEAMTLHGYDLNSNADSALFQGILPRWIADHGPAVVMIDHVVKNKDEQGRFALGAQHKLAGIDGAAYVVKKVTEFGRGKRGMARVDVAKDRPGHVREYTIGRGTVAEFSLDASIDGNILTASLMPPNLPKPGEHAFEPTGLMEKISRYVQANPGMSKKSIESAMNGKATAIRLALELLITRGFIASQPGTRGAIHHHHIKSYYAEQPELNGDDE